MLFTNKITDRKINLRVKNSTPEQKSECRFLGVIVDENINWKSHKSCIKQNNQNNSTTKTSSIHVSYTHIKNSLYVTYSALP